MLTFPWHTIAPLLGHRKRKLKRRYSAWLWDVYSFQQQFAYKKHYQKDKDTDVEIIFNYAIQDFLDLFMISKGIANHSGQNENKFPNVRISYKTEISVKLNVTDILTHKSLENPVVSGVTGKWQGDCPIWWSCPQRMYALTLQVKVKVLKRVPEH